MSVRKFKPLISCSVVVTIAVVLSGCSSTPAVSLAQEKPAKILEYFYRWYIDYPGNALADGAYRSSEHLSEGFVEQLRDHRLFRQGGLRSLSVRAGYTTELYHPGD